MQAPCLTIGLFRQRQLSLQGLGVRSRDEQPESATLRFLLQRPVGAEHPLAVIRRDAPAVVGKTNRQWVGFDANVDHWTIGRLAISADLHPVNRVREQVLKDLDHHALYELDLQWPPSFYLHIYVMTRELSGVAIFQILDQPNKVESLRALPAGHARFVENAQSLRYALDLSAQRIEPCLYFLRNVFAAQSLQRCERALGRSREFVSNHLDQQADARHLHHLPTVGFNLLDALLGIRREFVEFTKRVLEFREHLHLVARNML